jgi:predicted ferric reductase
MNGHKNLKNPLMAPRRRLILGILVGAVAAGILAGATLVVFQDKEARTAQVQDSGKPASITSRPEAWTRSAGRVFGLLAATMLFLQFGLSSKLKTLDRIFGLHRMLYFHRILGLSLVILVSFHPLFIFASSSEGIGPLRLTIWPELLGIVLLIGLWTGVCAALWRRFLSLGYQGWYLMHRVGMFGAMVIVTLHVWNVTHDFHHGWPFYSLGAALLLYGSLFFWTVVLKTMLLRRRLFTVAKVELVGKDVHAVELAPADGEVFSYAPGQFAFVTFLSEALPVERHHWTLSSTPTRPKTCTLTIKCSGDFTALLGRLKAGDRAVVDGPYGLFSFLAHVRGLEDELVMISGGIGITPMLGMLRYMADTGDRRKVTLVWSNRTEGDILCREEIEGMKGKLPDFAIHHVLSQQKDFKGQTGRLTLGTLEKLLSGCNREASVFVCGPPPMMDVTCKNLRGLNFKSSRIYQERFSY